MDLSTLQLFLPIWANAIICIVLWNIEPVGISCRIIMPLSGIMAAKRKYQFFLVMSFSVRGAWKPGAVCVGQWRRGVSESYIRKFPKQKEVLERKLEWIRQKGCMGVFVGKLLPMIGLSSPFRQGGEDGSDEICDQLCLWYLIWNFAFIGAGYVLGDQVFPDTGLEVKAYNSSVF